MSKVPDYFPSRESLHIRDDISEKQYMDDIIGVWCMNSFSATEGYLLKHYILPNKRDGKTEISMKIEDAERIYQMMERIQMVYTYLWLYWRDNYEEKEAKKED